MNRLFCHRVMDIRPASPPRAAHCHAVLSPRVLSHTKRNRVVVNIEVPCENEPSTATYQTTNEPKQRINSEASAIRSEKYRLTNAWIRMSPMKP